MLTTVTKTLSICEATPKHSHARSIPGFGETQTLMSQLKEGLLPREAEKEVRFVDRSGNDERSYGMNWLEGVEAKDVTTFLFFEDWFHSFAALSTGTIIITILVAVHAMRWAEE